jgi:serine phosphatase RsbU (regulator of sigma subunit)
MNKPIQILYIEDNPDDVQLVKSALKKAGVDFEIHIVGSEKEFVAGLHDLSPNIVLSDHSLPGFNSLEAYKIITEQKPETPFILLTGTVSEEFAVDCLLSGIDDYILKSNLIRLPSSIDRILSRKKIKEEKYEVEKLLAELQHSHKEIEIKNKEITDSINYAKRIQDAILPNDKQFHREFPSGFISYSPRDIVSGDFYWLTRTVTSDDKNIPLRIIAAFDCTGHGIPGAFMSLLASVLLNDALKNKEVNYPSDILYYLNQTLPDTLNRNSKEKISDGLDMALCAFNHETRTLYFAGANRPLWILRKINGVFDIIQYKGTKASIGSHTPRSQEFENLVIQLESKDRIFMFTDGITDQFGGVTGKKLGRKRLKELLLHTAHFDMQTQKEFISDFILKWKGTFEQVDDMLIIGIEVI